MPDLFASIIDGYFTATTYLICTATALLCGVICALISSYRSHVSKSFLVALILLPVIVETVIIMVNGNIGTGVAVMGAFSLVRFRSVPGKAKDIVSIFLAMTAGLATAAGHIGIALVFTVIVCLVMFIVMNIRISSENTMELRITIPESMNFSGAFDDIFANYTKNHRLISVKTSGMGSLYKLSYCVTLKNNESTKDFLDELRTRNGNLEVALMESLEKGEEL